MVTSQSSRRASALFDFINKLTWINRADATPDTPPRVGRDYRFGIIDDELLPGYNAMEREGKGRVEVGSELLNVSANVAARRRSERERRASRRVGSRRGEMR